MSSSRVFLEVVFWIFVEIVEFGVGVERILDQGHFEGVPDLAEVGVGGDADGVAVSYLQCYF
jgi:hypothetical protein